MSRERTLTRSFAGGEITPELFGRVDLTKFQTGLAHCENLIVLPHGPATCRPGLQYVLQTKQNNVRLIPFSFNTEQTYILEVGNQYVRVHTNGQTVLAASQVVTSVTSAAVGVLTYTGADPANGTWMYLAGITGMTQLNGRFVKVANVNAGAKTYQLHDLRDNPINTSGYSAGSGGTMSPVYELASPFLQADLFDLNFVQSADVLTIVHPGYAVRELRRLTASTFQFTSPAFTPVVTPPPGLGTTPFGSGGTPKQYWYCVTGISEGTLDESLASNVDTETLDLSVAGNSIGMIWGSTSGPSGDTYRYNVYKSDQGVLGPFGYIGSSVGISFMDDNIIPDFSITPPLQVPNFNSANHRPGAVSYFEQRRVFAGTNNEPIRFWLTRTGTESTMTRSIPPRDDDAIRGRVVSREVNEIRHIIPLTDLLLLTSGGEWVLGSSTGGALTAYDARVRPQSYQGCSKIIPQVTGNSVLFVQFNNKRVFEIGYSDDIKAYKPRDASILAPHLFDDHTLVDASYSRSPDQIFWATRSDGTLLGMTYVPEHEVTAWHQHTTQGEFKSVATVSENGGYALYCAVERVIDGDTVTYLERLAPRTFATLADWFGVDSGLTYSGSPVTTLTGLWHLEGEEVDVLADGAVVPGLTVTNGGITLAQAASKVHVGLPYAPLAQTLPASFERVAAGGLGFLKNVDSMYLRVNRSSGVQAGWSMDRLRTYPQRTTEPYGSPPALVSDEIQIELDMPWDSDAQLWITREGPLPMTLTALSLEVVLGG